MIDAVMVFASFILILFILYLAMIVVLGVIIGCSKLEDNASLETLLSKEELDTILIDCLPKGYAYFLPVINIAYIIIKYRLYRRSKKK